MVNSYQGNAYDPYYKYPSAGAGTSVILYRSPSEVVPLLPGKPERSVARVHRLGGLLALLVFLFAAYHAGTHLLYCPPDPSTRDAIRRDWQREEAQHAVTEREWQSRKQAQLELELAWQRELKRHEEEVIRRIAEEQARREHFKQEWSREMERHAREFEEMQRREREERERERERWRREVEERDRREEEERQRRHLFWGNVEAHTCTTYGTRAYTAQLMNLPADWKHRADACKATPLEIHGISHLPKTCEDRGLGVVIGRWEINQQEPDCATYWDEYNDKGCTSPGSGKKYITYHLMNLPEKSDWREFCATTPARFNNMQFPGAQECILSIWGVFGQWEIDDSNCN